MEKQGTENAVLEFSDEFVDRLVAHCVEKMRQKQERERSSEVFDFVSLLQKSEVDLFQFFAPDAAGGKP